MTCIIDGDIIVYMFAGEGMKGKTEVEICRLVNETVEEILVNTTCSNYLGFLGTGHSFRRRISEETTKMVDPTTGIKEKFQYVQTYKGNRDNRPKPKWFHLVRQVLTDHWKFERVHEIEADDALRICGLRFDPCVLATNDKDADQNALPIYSIRDKRIKFITPEEATFNFYKQLIMGDQSDSVTGIPGLGEVNATRILREVTPDLYYQTVLGLYEETYGEHGLKVYQITRRLIKLLDSWPLFKIPEPIPFTRNVENNRENAL